MERGESCWTQNEVTIVEALCWSSGTSRVFGRSSDELGHTDWRHIAPWYQRSVVAMLSLFRCGRINRKWSRVNQTFQMEYLHPTGIRYDMGIVRGAKFPLRAAASDDCQPRHTQIHRLQWWVWSFTNGFVGKISRILNSPRHIWLIWISSGSSIPMWFFQARWNQTVPNTPWKFSTAKLPIQLDRMGKDLLLLTSSSSLKVYCNVFMMILSRAADYCHHLQENIRTGISGFWYGENSRVTWWHSTRRKSVFSASSLADNTATFDLQTVKSCDRLYHYLTSCLRQTQIISCLQGATSSRHRLVQDSIASFSSEVATNNNMTRSYWKLR